MAAPVVKQLTRPLYLTRPLLFKHRTQVTEVGKSLLRDSTFYWIKLKETIFHPQGGGQLSDIGTINGIGVDYVHKEKIGKGYDFDIVHCFKAPVSFKFADVVELTVDSQNRHLNSVWHTAAHVVDYIVVKCFPKLRGDSGQCYPNNAFMKFVAENDEFPTPAQVKEAFAKTVDETLKLPSSFVEDGGIRKLKIGDHPIPCGGTHIESLSEITKLDLKNVTLEKKEKKLRISFTLTFDKIEGKKEESKTDKKS